MRFLICADYHCRNRPEGALYLYRRLLRTTTIKAIHTGCNFIFHVGDIIHEKHCVLVELLLMLYQEFEWARQQNITWVLIPGNHDMPDKSKPAQTILGLFKRVAQVYVNPRILRGDGWTIYLQPFRLPEAFKRNCAELAKAARSDDNPFRLQLAHIGLAEGVMSESNSYRVPSPIRVADLYPQHYTLTMCGDYHSTQQLHDRLWYIGAPIAHMHGDVPNQGVWVVDTATKAVDQVELPGSWPEFITKTLDKREELLINPDFHYKLKVSAEMKPFYQLQYGDLPNVKIETVAGQVNPGARRLEGVGENDTRKILKIWLEKKGYLDEQYFELGDEYLSRAERVLFEARA